MGLTLSERIAAKLISALTVVATGYSPRGLSEEWIGTMGIAGFFRFSVKGAKILGRMTKTFGEVNAQFLAGLAAGWNGCGFCGYGHTITGALLHFDEHEEVHPLHPEQIEHMLDCTDADSIAYIESLLKDEPYAPLHRLARRMYALKMGEVQADSAEDELLVAAVWLYTWTTECTITLGLTAKPEDAVPYGHPIYRKKALRARYEEARSQIQGDLVVAPS